MSITVSIYRQGTDSHRELGACYHLAGQSLLTGEGKTGWDVRKELHEFPSHISILKIHYYARNVPE